IRVLKCSVVGTSILVAEVAPVATEMTLEIGHGIEHTSLNQVVHARGHDYLAGSEARLRQHCECHGDYLSRKNGATAPDRGDVPPVGGCWDGTSPSVNNDQRMVNTCP